MLIRRPFGEITNFQSPTSAANSKLIMPEDKTPSKAELDGSGNPNNSQEEEGLSLDQNEEDISSKCEPGQDHAHNLRQLRRKEVLGGAECHQQGLLHLWQHLPRSQGIRGAQEQNQVGNEINPPMGSGLYQNFAG